MYKIAVEISRMSFHSKDILFFSMHTVNYKGKTGFPAVIWSHKTWAQQLRSNEDINLAAAWRTAANRSRWRVLGPLGVMRTSAVK